MATVIPPARAVQGRLRELFAELGEALLTEGRHPEAAPAFRSALQEPGDSPSDARIRSGLARAYEALGREEEALELLLVAALDPAAGADVVPRAHALLTPGRALALDPRRLREPGPPGEPERGAPLQGLLGRVALYRREYERARQHFEDALRTEPEDLRALEGLGEALWRAGHADAGEARLREALARAERRADRHRAGTIRYKLAGALLALGQHEEALRLAGEGRELGGRSAAEFDTLLGRCHLAGGDAQKAHELAGEALSISPDDHDARVVQARALLRLGRPAEALEAARSALRDLSDDADALLLEALALARDGRPQATPALNRYARRVGSDAGWHLVRGEMLMREGALAEAMEHFEQGLALDPSNADLRWSRGEALLRQDDAGPAVEAFREITAAEPRNGLAHLRLATALLRSGRAEEALGAVTTSLSIGVHGPGDHPETDAYELEAEILQALDRSQAAARSNYEAGRRRYWLGEYERAAQLLARAESQNPGHVPTYLYGADSLRCLSIRTEWPYSDPDTLRDALATWDRAPEPPDPSFAWAFVGRALISSQLAQLPWEDRTARRWEAITYLERSCALDDANPLAWSNLARELRLVDLHRGAVLAAERALALDDDDELALLELAGSLANLGRPEESERAFARYLEAADEPDPTAYGIPAFLAYQRGDLDAALAELDAGLSRNPDDVWSHYHRGRCLLGRGEVEQARAEFRRVLELTDPSTDADPAEAPFRAMAAHFLGETALAIGILEPTIGSPEADSFETRGNLAQCYLAAGQPERARALLEAAIRGTPIPRQIRDTIEELEQLRSGLVPGTDPDDLAATVPPMIALLRSAEAALQAEPPGPEDELRGLVPDGVPATPRELGSLAALARLQADRGAPAAATDSYARLLESRRFPEAALALLSLVERQIPSAAASGDADTLLRTLDLVGRDAPERAFATRVELARAQARRGDLDAALQTMERGPDQDRGPEATLAEQVRGDLLASAGAFERARQAYRDGLARSREARTRDPVAGLEARLALLELSAGEPAAAMEHLKTATGGASGNGGRVDPRSVVNELAELVDTPGEYHDLMAALRALGEAAPPGSTDRHAAVDARLDLALTRYEGAAGTMLGTDGAASLSMIPVVTPVAIEADGALFPSTEGWESKHPLFALYLPGLRRRIQASMGCRVPGVRIRGNDGELGGGLYILIVHEVPMVSGTVYPGHRFCPAADRARELLGPAVAEAPEAADPATGHAGLWVDERHAAQLEGAGLPLLDPYQFMVHHLGEVLQDHLASFLELDGLGTLLDDHPDLAAALPDLRSRHRFLRLLQGLLHERVPVTALAELVEVFREHDGAPEPGTVIDAARIRVRDQLPGNDGRTPIFRVAPSLEDEIAGSTRSWAGRRFLGLTPESAQAVLAAVRERRDLEGDRGWAILVREPEVRRHLRRLTELEFPRVPVLAEPELTPESTRRVHVDSIALPS